MMASWATALTTTPTCPSRLWPARSRRLPQEATTACFSRATAACGPWATTLMASWATALTQQHQPPRADCGQQRHGHCRGTCHSLFLKSDGSLWAMGGNYVWRVGRRHLQRHQPPRADCDQRRHGDCRRRHTTACFSRATAACGSWAGTTMASWATALYNNTNRPEQIVASGVTAIAAGGNHSLFLKSDGSLWAHGRKQQWPVGRRHLQQHQPARGDCGQQCHGDCCRR